MDLIRSNKKGLRHGRFCSFQCFKIWSDCLNFKHWPILSSASGALLIFTVKSTLNYTRVLRQSITKKKKKEAINNTQIWRRCMRHLIRTYTVREFIYRIWDRQTMLIKTKKKRKKTGAFKRCILLSLSVKRPLIFWTRRLHGARMLSVWEDLTFCDFLDIIDSWKLVGWGKMGFKAQTCWTDLLAFWGVWNRSRILNFGPDRLFFRFSRALISMHNLNIFQRSI